MLQFTKKFWCCDSGVTSVEYALLAAAASVSVGVFGASFYSKVSTAFNNITVGAATPDPNPDPGTTQH